MSPTSAVFHIQGARLTDLARELLLEGGDEAQCICLLTEGLAGLSVDQAIRILAGKARLTGDTRTGDGTLDLEADDCQRTQDAIRLRWLGRFKQLKRWWEPYMVVDQWRAKDALFAQKHAQDYAGNPFAARWEPNTWSRNSALRSLCYARDPANDCASRIGGVPSWRSGIVLSREVPAPGLVAYAVLGKDFAPTAPESSVVNLLPRAQPDDGRVNESSAPTPLGRAPNLRPNLAAHPAATEADCSSSTETRRAAIRAQADRLGGWYDVHVSRHGNDARPKLYRIPRAPLDRHVARIPITGDIPLRIWPEWKNIHGSGMRMFGDSPDHSDWMFGSDPPIEPGYDNSWSGAYDSPLDAAIWHLRGTIRCTDSTSVHVEHIAGPAFAGSRAGLIVHAQPDTTVPSGSIVIAPHAGMEYYMAAHSAGPQGCVIVEAGGELAHLSVQAAEDRYTLLLLPGAQTIFPASTRARVYFDSTGEPHIDAD